MLRRLAMFALFMLISTLLAAQTSANWPQSWTGGGSDQPKSIDMDSNGNVYVGGYTTSFESSGEDVLLLKFDATGNTLQSFAGTWGPFNVPIGAELGNDLRVGPDGFVYLVASGQFPALLKFDANGNPQWQVSASVPGVSFLNALAFDSSQNILVAAGGTMAVPLRFASDGSLSPSQPNGWSVANVSLQTTSIATDANTNIIIAGSLYDYTAQVIRPFVVKYDSQGVFQWGRVWVSSVGVDIASNSRIITTDSQGNVYLAGAHSQQSPLASPSSTYVAAPFLLRINSDGSFGWAKTWDVSQFGSLGFGSVHMNSDGNLLVAGGGGSPHVSIIGEVSPTSGTMTQSYTRTGTLGSGANAITRGAIIEVASATSNTSYTAVTLAPSDVAGQLTTPSYSLVPASGTSTQLGPQGTWTVTSRAGIWNPSLPLASGNLVLVTQIPASILSHGTIAVTTNLSAATFSVSGPATFSGSGTSATFNNAPAGIYTTTFGTVAGYITPSSQTQTLAAGGALAFAGTYSAVSIAPNGVNFPDTYIGGTSAVQYVTVTNGSGKTVTMGAITASPNFVVNGGACVSISAKKSCRISVKFQPSAAGPLTGALTINETNPTGTQSVSLSGTGYYRIGVSPNPLTPFPDTGIGTLSPTQCATVTNNTTNVLTIGAVSASAGFVVDKNSTTCSTSLAASSSCQACAQFKPTVLGAITGTLNISTGLGAQKVALSGIGVSGGIVPSAQSLSLPDTKIGSTSAAKYITLTNYTGAAVTMGTVVASQDFLSSSNTCGTTLSAGGRCNVYAQFHPSTAGAETGTLTISETVPVDSQEINLFGTGLNLVPKITSLDPASGAAGAGGFVINVYGSHFTNSSTVQWNGANRVTTFVNSGQLRAQVLSGDINAQNTAYLNVVNQAPGGGISNQASFTIKKPTNTCFPQYVALDPSPADCDTVLVEDESDTADLGTRTPLILIHGLDGSPSNTFLSAEVNRAYWLSFLNYFTESPDFLTRYKVFRFQYYSNKYTTWELGRALRNAIDYYVYGAPNDRDKQIVIVAHSMGGLVAREYMNEQDTHIGTWGGQRAGTRIVQLVTLATPHHGTPLANGAARTNMSSFGPLWSPVFTVLDGFSWFLQNNVSETNPNRSDLRFDNFNGMWNSNPGYTSPGEHNILLEKISHAFDNKIVAYFGYIGTNSDITHFGLLDPGSLAVELAARNNSGDQDGALNALAVMQQRIWDSNLAPFSTVTQVDNDGMVPKVSAAFDCASTEPDCHVGLIQVECRNHDHLQMRDGQVVLGVRIDRCETGYDIMTSLAHTLGVTPPQ